jgi:hypothetical protein
MHQNNETNDPISHTDDTHVLRYLLHNIKGISPVSGGVLGESLELEYAEAEQEYRETEQE